MHKRRTYVEYTPDLQSRTRKKRVCAYARVSGDHEDAFHSLSAQISYYQNKIAEHPDWEFVEVFSDRGITGTKDDREGFQHMLAACRDGRVDIVLAKSITRFARNTVILLETVRELKSLGVDVHFEEEHIETLSSKGEVILSVLAAKAQEESRQVSENKKWQYQKAFQKGIPFNSDCYGYRIVDHRIWMEEDEAPIVKRIFELYLSGMGTTTIANTLTQEGVTTRKGTAYWSDGIIRYMLQNEIYCGDLRLQKTYSTDHITKKIKINRGEKPMYYIKDDHDAIIPREMFEAVQQELKRRSQNHPTKGSGKVYPFTRFVKCANCGSHLCRLEDRRNPSASTKRWVCVRAHHYGKRGCEATRLIREDVLTETTCSVLNVDSLEGIDLRSKFKEILFAPDELIYKFLDGTEKHVVLEKRTHKTAWTSEKRKATGKQTADRWKQRKEKQNGS